MAEPHSSGALSAQAVTEMAANRRLATRFVMMSVVEARRGPNALLLTIRKLFGTNVE